jgi:hypothetical protein
MYQIKKPSPEQGLCLQNDFFETVLELAQLVAPPAAHGGNPGF